MANPLRKIPAGPTVPIPVVVTAALALVGIAAVIIFAANSPEKFGRSAAPAAPKLIAFRDLYLDAKDLADRRVDVRVDGAISTLGFETLEPPEGGAGNSVRLWTGESPRAVRETLYACAQRGLADTKCRFRVTGQMTTCWLQINDKMQFPCLYVRKLEPMP